MRILLLTQWFDPEPTIKGLPFARALVRAGHEVHVITGFPNYPGGRVYPGYRIRPWTREVVEGIPVTRVALYPSHDRSAVGRVLNYLSFAITAAIAGVFARFEPDVLYVYHPPLSVGFAAAVVKAVRGVPIVYDVQDLWPETLEATGMLRSGVLLRMIGKAVDAIYARADVIVAQSPGFLERIVGRGVSPGKVRLIYNWCDEAALAKRAEGVVMDLEALDGRFNVVFAGNMGKAQALDAVLSAAAIVKEQDASIQFVFIGDGTEAGALAERARRDGLHNVVFLPRLDMDRIGFVLDRADALLVHLRNSPLFGITVPSKTQAYMFSARPIIMAVPGDAAHLVREAGAGVVAESENPASIADAVLSLSRQSPAERSAMGARGRRFYDDTLSLAQGTRHMIDAFRDAQPVSSRAVATAAR